MDSSVAKGVIGIGVLLVVIGLVFYWAGDKLSWIGKLPGDIRVERENMKIYFPITTMLLVSGLLNLIIYLAKKLFS